MAEPFQEVVGSLRKKDMQLSGIIAICMCHYHLEADHSGSSRPYSRISSNSTLSFPYVNYHEVWQKD